MLDQPAAYHSEANTPYAKCLNKSIEAEYCLRESYRVDSKAISVILTKLNPLLENCDLHPLVDSFIKKSYGLNISFSNKQASALPADDAVVQAPEWHEILFENAAVRVLWIDSKPGDREPYHTHHWKSIMVITQPGHFKIENADGTVENDLWPIGVYELPADTQSSAYTNTGDTEFKALRFEIK